MGNTVGSLSKVQNELIIGTILGDGSLRRKTNTLLEINHSKKQKEYCLWKYEFLKDIVKTPPKERVSGKNREAVRFTTVSTHLLNKYFQMFYSQELKRKIIPSDLKLTLFSLAVWFMDDGSNCRDSVYFNTQQYTVDEQNHLRAIIKNQFGLESALNRDKKYFRIRLSSSSGRRLHKLILNLIPNCMKYKVLI
ncbi:hypothetical protein KJ678_02945 [Patescibacteria group bacterium]|nr:hypothetical protein [Patescibacteria group bacterium]